jgi:hypothetical protein
MSDDFTEWLDYHLENDHRVGVGLRNKVLGPPPTPGTALILPGCAFLALRQHCNRCCRVDLADYFLIQDLPGYQ